MGKRPVANDDDEVVNKRGDPGQLWWVDDEGAWHLVDTESPEAYLSCPIGQSREQQGFAFRDLGFMKINTAEGHLDIQWDVDKVAPAAVDSVLTYLDGTDRTKPVSLSFFYEGWNREIQQSQQAAMDRIGQAQAYRGVELLNSVMLHRHDLDDVNRNCNLIRHGFRAWQESGGRLSLDRDAPFDPLMPEMLIFMPDDFGELFRYLYVGKDSDLSRVFGSSWASKAAGRTTAPDNLYNYKLNKSYAGVLDSGEPRLDHIRARIQIEAADPIWTSYQRLLAPGELEDGSPVIVCLSKMTSDVSVKFMAGAA